MNKDKTFYFKRKPLMTSMVLFMAKIPEFLSSSSTSQARYRVSTHPDLENSIHNVQYIHVAS